MPIKRIADLTPDPKNANKHTERGMGMLEKSLRNYGGGRSILLDKNGVVIAGNAVVETAAQIGMDDVVVVQSDGTKIVAVQRTDLDLAALNYLTNQAAGVHDSRYSSIEHLARCLHGSRFAWQEVSFAVFTAVFDASGKKNLDFLVVAGFVANAKTWDEFSQLWNERLDRDGIRYFTMKEFSQCRGEFDGWRGDEKRRRSLLADLIKIIQGHACYKVAHVVPNAGVANARAAFPESERRRFLLEAYAVAGYSCRRHLVGWARQEGIRSPIESVFDRGDLDRGRLLDLFKLEGWSEPIFRPSRDENINGSLNPGFTPLQAADLLANEVYQIAPELPLVNQDDLRYPMRELYSLPGPIITVALENWERLKEKLPSVRAITDSHFRLKKIADKGRDKV